MTSLGVSALFESRTVGPHVLSCYTPMFVTCYHLCSHRLRRPQAWLPPGRRAPGETSGSRRPTRAPSDTCAGTRQACPARLAQAFCRQENTMRYVSGVGHLCPFAHMLVLRSVSIGRALADVVSSSRGRTWLAVVEYSRKCSTSCFGCVRSSLPSVLASTCVSKE